MLPNFLSLVSRLLRGTWLWDKLLPLQHLESCCPWASLWSTEDWLPLTTCGHRKPCFINKCPLPLPISLLIDPRKPGVCLKGCGIQTKKPLPPTSYTEPVYRNSPTSSALHGQHCRSDLWLEQRLRNNKGIIYWAGRSRHHWRIVHANISYPPKAGDPRYVSWSCISLYL